MKEEVANQLAHTLLIELLSFQFASPVKWIETQDVLINHYKIDNLIEIGPQPILGNMMKKTCLEKNDSIKLGRQKLTVNTYCVSNIDSIPYYEPKKLIENEPIIIKDVNDTTKNEFVNFYKDQINLDAVGNNKNMLSYQEFVANESLQKVSKTPVNITEVDAEKEKLRFKQYQQELQSSSFNASLLHEYTKIATELEQSIVAPVKERLRFEVSKIREYDNPHAWIRCLAYDIATCSSLTRELNSSIIRLLKVFSANVGIQKEIEQILEYNGKSMHMLKMFVSVYQKEQSMKILDDDERCDSGITLYDNESSSSEDMVYEQSICKNSILLKWNTTASQFVENSNYFFNSNNPGLKHDVNQCDIVFIDEVNIDNNFFEFIQKYYEEDYACLFVAIECENLDTFFLQTSKLKNYYSNNCTLNSKLYVLPYSKTEEDYIKVIECVYNCYCLNIGRILVHDGTDNVDGLIKSVSLAKSKLSYITAKTYIISPFVSTTKFANALNQEHTEQIQFEVGVSSSIDFTELFSLTGNIKVIFRKNHASIVDMEDTTFCPRFNKFILPTVKLPSVPKPTYQSYQRLQTEFNAANLQDFLDPKNLVVITGFSEIGPLGNAITRWDYEKNNSLFSTESILHLCLIMNILKYDSKTSIFYEVSSNKEVGIKEIMKYENHILEHTGIRVLEEEIVNYKYEQKKMLQEIVLMQNFKVVVCEELMKEYQLMHAPKNIKILPSNGENMYEVNFLPGTKLYLPKAFKFDRYVAGQIPLGWDASNYGISQDIINQVDRLTLFALITTVEALFTSGIIDPYELYEYMDITKVGNCSGSGIGGLQSHQNMQKMRFLNQRSQNDIIQETFINSMSAWINMLVLSSAGPLKTPVGACATALESLDLGYDVIMSGKANVVLVGGYDDLSEETSYEFANMGATSNAKLEREKYGRIPQEICRPMTKSRNGFTESQGSGMQVLVRGDIAIEMGLPCFGIVNYTSINADKISKSLPAPGKGVLTSAKKVKSKFKQRKLDIEYRKRQVGKDADYFTKRYWQVDFSKNDQKISPIEGSLSIFGLNINDIGVSSCHGTSTKSNDKNETSIINTILENHERTKGNVLPIVCQKAITGHPKAAAGAWMLNGLLQMFQDNTIPGNVNADNVDKDITRDNDYLLIHKTNIQPKSCIKAGMLTSFGFGQKGALAIILNPNYLLACLNEKEYKEYMTKFEARYQKANYEYGYRMLHKTLFQEKTAGPYGEKPIEDVYLGI